MQIKYLSQKTPDKETKIEYVSENSIRVNGELYEFPSQFVSFPDVSKDTSGVIVSAKYINTVLYIELLRQYIQECQWDTGDYQEVTQ